MKFPCNQKDLKEKIKDAVETNETFNSLIDKLQLDWQDSLDKGLYIKESNEKLIKKDYKSFLTEYLTNEFRMLVNEMETDDIYKIAEFISTRSFSIETCKNIFSMTNNPYFELFFSQKDLFTSEEKTKLEIFFSNVVTEKLCAFTNIEVEVDLLKLIKSLMGDKNMHQIFESELIELTKLEVGKDIKKAAKEKADKIKSLKYQHKPIARLFDLINHLQDGKLYFSRQFNSLYHNYQTLAFDIDYEYNPISGCAYIIAKGYYISMSQIVEMIENKDSRLLDKISTKRENVKKETLQPYFNDLIVLAPVGTVLIDCNIPKNREGYPNANFWHGKNISILAKTVVITDDWTWDVSGKHAHVYNQARSKAHKNGRHGRPGENSGDITITATELHTQEQKTLNLLMNGGNGTEGENGMDGEPCKNGFSLSEEELLNRYSPYDDNKTKRQMKPDEFFKRLKPADNGDRYNVIYNDSSTYFCRIKVKNERENKEYSNEVIFSCSEPENRLADNSKKDILFLFKGSKCKMGKDAGKGGKGGHGGHGGNNRINIEFLPPEKKLQIFKVSQENGINGVPGQNGSVESRLIKRWDIGYVWRHDMEEPHIIGTNENQRLYVCYKEPKGLNENDIFCAYRKFEKNREDFYASLSAEEYVKEVERIMRENNDQTSVNSIAEQYVYPRQKHVMAIERIFDLNNQYRQQQESILGVIEKNHKEMGVVFDNIKRPQQNLEQRSATQKFIGIHRTKPNNFEEKSHLRNTKIEDEQQRVETRSRILDTIEETNNVSEIFKEDFNLSDLEKDIFKQIIKSDSDLVRFKLKQIVAKIRTIDDFDKNLEYQSSKTDDNAEIGDDIAKFLITRSHEATETIKEIDEINSLYKSGKFHNRNELLNKICIEHKKCIKLFEKDEHGQLRFKEEFPFVSSEETTSQIYIEFNGAKFIRLNEDLYDLCLKKQAIIRKFNEDKHVYWLNEFGKDIEEKGEKRILVEMEEFFPKPCREEFSNTLARLLKLEHIKSCSILFRNLYYIFSLDGCHLSLDEVDYLIDTVFLLLEIGKNNEILELSIEFISYIIITSKQEEIVDKLIILCVEYGYERPYEPIEFELDDFLKKLRSVNLAFKLLLGQRLNTCFRVIKSSGKYKILRRHELVLLFVHLSKIDDNALLNPELFKDIDLKNWTNFIKDKRIYSDVSKTRFRDLFFSLIKMSETCGDKEKITKFIKSLDKSASQSKKVPLKVIKRFVYRISQITNKNVLVDIINKFDEVVDLLMKCHENEITMLDDIKDVKIREQIHKLDKILELFSDGSRNMENIIAKLDPPLNKKDRDRLRKAKKEFEETREKNPLVERILENNGKSRLEEFRFFDNDSDSRMNFFHEAIKKIERHSWSQSRFISLIDLLDRVVKIKKGFNLTDAQRVTIWLCLRKKSLLARVATGEGKSLIITVIAIINALLGAQVNIITSSPLLATRDANERDIYDAFNIKVGHNISDDKSERGNVYENCHVVYGTLSSFQSDYLWENFHNDDKEWYLEELKFHYSKIVIIDEVDSMLLDNANNVLYMSHDIDEFEKLKSLFVFIWHTTLQYFMENGIYDVKNSNAIKAETRAIYLSHSAFVDKSKLPTNKMGEEMWENMLKKKLIDEHGFIQMAPTEFKIALHNLGSLYSDDPYIKHLIERFSKRQNCKNEILSEVCHEIFDFIEKESISEKIWTQLVQLGVITSEGQIKVHIDEFLNKIEEHLEKNSLDFQRLKFIAKNIKYHRKITNIPHCLRSFVERNLNTFIENAITAFYMNESEDYVIDIADDNQKHPNIVIIDHDTGVDEKLTHWNNGLHQFLQLKHGCELSPLSLQAIFISNVSYIKKYKNIVGLTGTLGSTKEKEMLYDNYQLPVIEIPTNHVNKFYEQEPILTSIKEKWFKFIYTEIKTLLIHEKPRSVLVICNTIKSCYEIHDDLQFQAKNDENLKEDLGEDFKGTVQL